MSDQADAPTGASPPPEPAPIRVRTREDLIGLLNEASEVEHGLMCTYLYAAFGLKRREEDGLRPEQVAPLARFRAAILGVAIEEMTHLALVSNLTCALGGRPHFYRQNFPVYPGYHPADLVVRLARFDMDTLDHFIFLERPRGSDVQDSPPFATHHRLVRGAGVDRGVMPTAQDYATVGDLYSGLRDGFDTLARELGEGRLFVGGREAQVGPDVASLPQLCVVTDLASAHAAIDTVIEQGEGAPDERAHSHFERFRAVKAEYEAILARDPGFEPSFPVANNPVMRRPPNPEDRVFVDAHPAAELLDVGNALYAAMVRVLVQAYGRRDPERADQRALVAAATDAMGCLIPVGEALARLPANPECPGVNAGLSFATLRNFTPVIEGPGEWELLAERFREIGAAAGELVADLPALASIPSRLSRIAAELAEHGRGRGPGPGGPGGAGLDGTRMGGADGVAVEAAGAPPGPKGAAPAAEGEEVAEGRDVTIRFAAGRCIHSRFCVLWQPGVFEASTPGAWIHPDAVPAEAVAAVIGNCPSGALSFERHDGGPSEAAPPVNLATVRENGPVAIRGEMWMDGAFIGFRRTFCRCGHSGNKPFCDGSHARLGFRADGGPAARAEPGPGPRRAA